MGSILNNSNPMIYPESTLNETDFESANETVIDIIEPPQTEKPMERGNESELISKLEQDGYDKLNALKKTLPPNQDVGKALLNIIQSGADEFKQKTGRTMTYAEMRAAYG